MSFEELEVAMERVTCPSCSGTAVRMPVLSDVSNVDYFQCEICRTVSLAPKEGGAPAVVDVLPDADGSDRRVTRI